jgi:translation elongation factor EF-Ts
LSGYDVAQPYVVDKRHSVLRFFFGKPSVQFRDFVRVPFGAVLKHKVHTGFRSEVLAYPVQDWRGTAVQMTRQN